MSAAGPISFVADMARATRLGLKTNTRRVITPQWARCLDLDDDDDRAKAIAMAPYKVGEVRWVREPLTIVDARVREVFDRYPDGRREVRGIREVRTAYDADYVEGHATPWTEYPERLADPKAGRHVAYGCPREFARTFVRITDVRVQRVQSISSEDAIAEGIAAHYVRPGQPQQWRNYLHGEGYCTSPVDSFRTLWDSINRGRGFGWDADPHVFAYTFTLVQGGE